MPHFTACAPLCQQLLPPSHMLQVGQECVCDVTCTFLEIYNDELRDLLAAQSTGSKIGIR